MLVVESLHWLGKVMGVEAKCRDGLVDWVERTAIDFSRGVEEILAEVVVFFLALAAEESLSESADGH